MSEQPKGANWPAIIEDLENLGILGFQMGGVIAKLVADIKDEQSKMKARDDDHHDHCSDELRRELTDHLNCIRDAASKQLCEVICAQHRLDNCDHH